VFVEMVGLFKAGWNGTSRLFRFVRVHNWTWILLLLLFVEMVGLQTNLVSKNSAVSAQLDLGCRFGCRGLCLLCVLFCGSFLH